MQVIFSLVKYFLRVIAPVINMIDIVFDKAHGKEFDVIYKIYRNAECV